MLTPLFSIIEPLTRRSSRCAHSWRSCSITDLIVIDNDTRDGTLEEALRGTESRVTVITTGGTLWSGGMNVGIREALSRNADRVLLVNSDVWVPPDSIDHLGRYWMAA